MNQWYCSVQGQRFGPVSREVIAGWIRDGRVTAMTQVWTEGMPSWAPAQTVESLRELLSAAPPPVSAPAAPYGPYGSYAQMTCPQCRFTGHIPKQWDSWVVPVAVIVALFTGGLGLLILLTPKKARCPQCGVMFDSPYGA